MARTRTIRPDFWDDEKISKVSRDARLTFIGLWNLSDDFGVVKGNLDWLKSKIYPYDAIKPDVFKKWIEELQNLKRIISFTTNGEKYFYITNFLKYQKINRPSEIMRNPPVPENILALSEYSVSPHGVLTDEIEREIEREIEKEREKEIEREKENKKIPLVELFNSTCPGFPKISKLSKSRLKKISARLKENPDLEWWRKVFETLNSTPFLCGSNDRGWKASFDWLIENDKNALKVYEGNYKTSKDNNDFDYKPKNENSFNIKDYMDG